MAQGLQGKSVPIQVRGGVMARRRLHFYTSTQY